MEILKDFSLLGLASLAVFIVVICALVRRVLELSFPSLVRYEIKLEDGNGRFTSYTNTVARLYNELGLYIMPFIVGALAAISKTSFVFGEIEEYAGRLMLALLVASFSGVFYKAAKKSIPTLFGVSVRTSGQVLEQPSKE